MTGIRYTGSDPYLGVPRSECIPGTYALNGGACIREDHRHVPDYTRVADACDVDPHTSTTNLWPA